MARSTRLGAALDHAGDHHGLLPAHVMLASGLSYEQMGELVRDRVIERIIRGLYRLRGSRTPLQDIAAAVYRHAGAVASHSSALFVHGLDVQPPARPHLTLPKGRTGGTTLGILHRSPLPRVDVTRRQRIPVTTVARSIVDAAEVLSEDRLADAVAQAISRQMVTVAAIDECALRLERAPGRKGSGRLRAVLSCWTEEIQPDSPAEAAAIRKMVSFGLPLPTTQYEIHDDDGTFLGRVDVAWPDTNVAREYDSPRYHGAHRTEADELRMQRIEQAGWSIDGLNRTHLIPGNVGWLHELRRDLAERRRPQAS